MKQQNGKDFSDDRRELALHMLYKTTEPTTKSIRYCTYAQVARVLGLTYGQVHHFCRHALRKRSKKPK